MKNKLKKTGLLMWFSWTIISLSLLAAPALVSADNTTTTKTEKIRCTVNSYGQETCNKETSENSSTNKVTYVDEYVRVTPYHQTLNTALTTGQSWALISLLSLALVAISLKLKASFKIKA